MYHKASEFYSGFLANYFDEHMNFSPAKAKRMDAKQNLLTFLLDTYGYIDWFEKEESADAALKRDKKRTN